MKFWQEFLHPAKVTEMNYIPLTPENIDKLKEQLPPVKTDYLNLLCLAIRDFEGAPGDRNYRNNNPGNCRYSSVGYLPIYGEVKRDAQNFAIFKDYETGWLYLKNLIIHKSSGHPEWNLISLFKEYAPPIENDSIGYATYVAKRMSVNPFTFQLKQLLT